MSESPQESPQESFEDREIEITNTDYATVDIYEDPQTGELVEDIVPVVPGENENKETKE